ncbi:hypothetical protein F1188_14555 [Roseospira marina]|uniref:Uncharacterized protein n=1 Tax=Roseospira marina TaxID=140057 RepID=A0A5M6I8Q4_9PROT|nr:hypothetical protein [Roseospira marina]KAA5604634.1 hypothetical protein F1188_14555 [Roseospira marina]MBB4315076.1 hypothetical protein [Roseospira marina]MBB5088154.1 hypothetical protein [Roseospira marina]
MIAIRLSFFAVALVFALLGLFQAWQAVTVLGMLDGALGGVIAALAGLGCFVAAIGTVKVTLDLKRP